MNKDYKIVILLSIFGSVLIVFILLPILRMLLSVNVPDIYNIIKDYEIIKSIYLTLISSLLATVIVFIFGIPLAYLLARYDFIGKRIIEGIIDLPIIIPHTAAGIALLFVFGKKYLIGKVFGFFGISFIGNILGISLAMAFVSLPFLVNSAKEGFKLVDPRYAKVARTLGANWGQSFIDIDFRLASKSIISGVLMMWGRGISEFGAVVILAYHPMTASVLIFERFNNFGLKYARPVAVLLIIICLFIFILIRTISHIKKRGKNAQTR